MNTFTKTLISTLALTATVSSGTAAAQVEEGDGYAAALVNFRYMANTVWTTDEVSDAMQAK